MKGLTNRQRQALEILIQTSEEGCQATARELCDVLGIASVNTAYQFYEKLQRKGFISLTPHAKARGVMILYNPDGSPYQTPKARLDRLVVELGASSYEQALEMARFRRTG